MNDFNTQVINEFRANKGIVGGRLEGRNVVVVHHTGAKSGTERVTPLIYQADGDGWCIFASKAGSTENPAWYFNLKANPDTKIEVGDEIIDVTCVEIYGDERDRIWEAQKAHEPEFAAYEESAQRVIPVLRFQRR